MLINKSSIIVDRAKQRYFLVNESPFDLFDKIVQYYFRRFAHLVGKISAILGRYSPLMQFSFFFKYF